MVDVGVRQLRRSRDRLERDAGGVHDAATAGLLLFYAVECGLKAELLRSVVQRPDTSGLPGRLRNHDLRSLAKELKLPAPVWTALTRCRRAVGQAGGTGGNHFVEPPDLHEAWRYGADLEHQDQKAVIEALRRLVRECKERQRG